MKKITLLFIAVILSCGIKAQKYLEEQTIASIGISYFNQAYSHLDAFMLKSPVIRVSQRIYWQDLIFSAETEHLPAHFTILRKAKLGVTYLSPLYDPKRTFLEGGFAFEYEKQDPAVSMTGKYTTFLVSFGARRYDSRWFQHRLSAAVGYNQGHYINPRYEEQVIGEDMIDRFRFLKFQAAYQAQLELLPMSLGTAAYFNHSKFNTEVMIDAYLKKAVDMGNVELEFKIGAQLPFIRNNGQSIFSADASHTTAAVIIERNNPARVFVGCTMNFQRGSKKFAF